MGASTVRRELLASVVAGLITLILAALCIWSAADDGGGYRRTPVVTSAVILLTIPLGVLLAALIGGVHSIPSRWVTVAGLLCAATWFQLLPLPDALRSRIGSGTVAVAHDFLPPDILQEGKTVAPLFGMPSAEPRSLSIAPMYTRMALATPAAFGLACWLATLAMRQSQWSLVFLGCIAAAGALFALLGIADALQLSQHQEVELRQRLLISPVGADDPFGPFVNNNSAAGFLNLTLGCAVGLFAFCLLRRSPPWQLVGCGIVIILITAGILGSNSRGGFLGLACGTAVLLVRQLSTSQTMTLRTKAFTVFGVALASIAAWFLLDSLGMQARTADRISTLYEGEAFEDPRLSHWRDGLQAAKTYLPFGSGLGTYRFAYLPYQQFSDGRWFMNADGMPVEWLVEGGVLFLPLLLFGFIGCWIDLQPLAVNLAAPVASTTDGDGLPAIHQASGRAVIAAMYFVLPALMVTQCFDFGILQPPLYLAFAGLCGACVAAARHAKAWRVATKAASNPAGNATAASATPYPILLCHITLALGLVGSLYYAWGPTRAAAVAEAAQLRFKAEVRSGNELQADFVPRQRTLRMWLSRYPQHGDLHRELARLILLEQNQLAARFLQQHHSISTPRIRSLARVETVRRAFYSGNRQLYQPPDSFLLPNQDIAAWKAARQHSLMALFLCPPDDIATIMLVELDMLESEPGRSTAALLTNAARLRSRNQSILSRLKRFAVVHPGVSSAGDSDPGAEPHQDIRPTGQVPAQQFNVQPPPGLPARKST